MTLIIRRLEVDDDRSGFRSGNLELDLFFIRYAGQNQFRHHIGTTYVALEEGYGIVGFATVAASELSVGELPLEQQKGLPHYPVPVLRLARLASDERAQGRGVGRALLRSVFALAKRMADEVGCAGVVVDAKPEAVAFYEKLGLEPMGVETGQLDERPHPLALFLTIGAISDAT